MASLNEPFSISSTFVVMDAAGSAIPMPVSDRFFEDLEHQFGDFQGKLLVSHFTFHEDWPTWERHPAGEEFVCLLSGQVDFILEEATGETKVALETPGSFVLVPRGIWHTAKVHALSTMLFITPGQNTQNRPL